MVVLGSGLQCLYYNGHMPSSLFRHSDWVGFRFFGGALVDL